MTDEDVSRRRGKVREVLTRFNMTQSALAEKLGVTQATVSYWVNGAIPVQPKWEPKLDKMLEADQ